MKRITLAMGLVAALALPAAVVTAKPPVDQANMQAAAAAEQAEDFRNAAKACAGERRSLGTTAFADRYGTNPNKSNAFGKCLSKHAADDDD